MRCSVTLASVGAVALGACASAQATRADDLPLRAGAAWVYHGTATDRAGSHAVDETVRVRDSDGRVAHLALDGQARVHELEWRGDVLYHDGDPWLAWPLTKGRRTCSDPKICWEVEAVDTVTLDVKGVAAVSRARWRVVERDNTGVMTVELVAGVGVATFRYHHNGSPDDVDVKLVELHGPETTDSRRPGSDPGMGTSPP
jgi:hypothetical protein